MASAQAQSTTRPLIVPLGDSAALVRFSTHLDDDSNRAALALAEQLEAMPIEGVVEIVPSLVSVLVRYDSEAIGFHRLAGEIALRLGAGKARGQAATHRLLVRFGGDDGPDLAEVSGALGLTPEAFIAAHNRGPLRVLTTGFAPGFVYCGFHGGDLLLSRRTSVRAQVPVGSVLFAAGQTAITATEVPTGWHVIGRTAFLNFDPLATPPTVLSAGDMIEFMPL
jgi:KipI family sensor histidine kinase inhibitor